LLDFPKTDLALWAVVLEGQELSDYIAEVLVDTNLDRV
jgi:hypothetical protein